MQLVDFDHPFFAPRWRRIATCGVIFGWAGFEFFSGAPFFGVLFAALGIYCGYGFFLRRNH
jgi:hypothetical protein